MTCRMPSVGTGWWRFSLVTALLVSLEEATSRWLVTLNIHTGRRHCLLVGALARLAENRRRSDRPDFNGRVENGKKPR